jgi:hypothetical protein
MPKNAILYRDYTDDGCSLYECLLCHEKWEDRRSTGWKFCSFCGTKWESEVRQKWVELPWRESPKPDPTKGHALVIEWFGPTIFEEDGCSWHFLEGYHNTENNLVELLPGLRRRIQEDNLHPFQPLCEYYEASVANRRAHTRIRVVKVCDLPEEAQVYESCGRLSIRRK